MGRWTGATSGGLKLQCIAIAIFLVIHVEPDLLMIFANVVESAFWAQNNPYAYCYLDMIHDI